MSATDRVAMLLDVAVSEPYGEAVAEVSRDSWVSAATAVRDHPALALSLFDLLTAVDEQEVGMAVLLRLWSPKWRHGLQLRVHCPKDDLHVPTLTSVFAGACWHERSTAEMFGVVFDGHPNPTPLLLPDGAGNPLRKEVLLASRVDRAWPGAPEPGQSSADAWRAAEAGPRRRNLPPGVPRPTGPLRPGSPGPA